MLWTRDSVRKLLCKTYLNLDEKMVLGNFLNNILVLYNRFLSKTKESDELFVQKEDIINLSVFRDLLNYICKNCGHFMISAK